VREGRVVTLISLLTHLVGWFSSLGAHHVYGTRQGGNGLVATKHWLVIACRIPAHLHGVLHCSGWVRR
jgi:hypothetical protein